MPTLRYPRDVQHKDIQHHVHFSPDGPQRSTVFETERLFSQVICLERNQSAGPMSDAGSDATLTILAGEAVFQVGAGRKRLKQWGTALVPAGMSVTVINASMDPLVVLMTTAPPPA